MTGARPTGSGNSSRVRVELFLASLLSFVLIASPASALLGELIDGVLNPPIAATADQPLPEPFAEQAAEPLLTILDPVVETVDQVIDEIVEDTGETLDPVIDVPPPIDPAEGNAPASNTTAGTSGGSRSNDEVSIDLDAEPISPSAVVLGFRERGLTGLEESLLNTDPTRALTRSIDVSTASSWLARLADWLPSSLASLVGLLAIPLKVIELLLRALLSAGSGLVAPASLLLALVFTMLVDRHPRSMAALRREIGSFDTRFAHGMR